MEHRALGKKTRKNPKQSFLLHTKYGMNSRRIPEVPKTGFPVKPGMT
jgi:hypothetical protein